MRTCLIPEPPAPTAVEPPSWVRGDRAAHEAQPTAAIWPAATGVDKAGARVTQGRPPGGHFLLTQTRARRSQGKSVHTANALAKAERLCD